MPGNPIVAAFQADPEAIRREREMVRYASGFGRAHSRLALRRLPQGYGDDIVGASTAHTAPKQRATVPASSSKEAVQAPTRQDQAVQAPSRQEQAARAAPEVIIIADSEGEHENTKKSDANPDVEQAEPESEFSSEEASTKLPSDDSDFETDNVAADLDNLSLLLKMDGRLLQRSNGCREWKRYSQMPPLEHELVELAALAEKKATNQPNKRTATTKKTFPVTLPVRLRLMPTLWPDRVRHLAAQYNPRGIRFPTRPSYGMCECRRPCRVDTCWNAKHSLFCTVECCPFSGDCGNGLADFDGLQPMRIVNTDDLTITTTKPIDAGVVLGEYRGEMSLEPTQASERAANSRYRLHMHRDPDRDDNVAVCINGEFEGSMMRFLNHSCVPTARFLEVGNGRRRTVVVATIRPVGAGEEITVDYGDELWFPCVCGTEACRDRDKTPKTKPRRRESGGKKRGKTARQKKKRKAESDSDE